MYAARQLFATSVEFKNKKSSEKPRARQLPTSSSFLDAYCELINLNLIKIDYITKYNIYNFYKMEFL